MMWQHYWHLRHDPNNFLKVHVDIMPLCLKCIASTSDVIFWCGTLAPLYPVVQPIKDVIDYVVSALFSWSPFCNPDPSSPPSCSPLCTVTRWATVYFIPGVSSPSHFIQYKVNITILLLDHEYTYSRMPYHCRKCCLGGERKLRGIVVRAAMWNANHADRYLVSFFFAAERRCPAAAEQCDDLMGVTNDLSGQRTRGGLFAPCCPIAAEMWR